MLGCGIPQDSSELRIGSSAIWCCARPSDGADMCGIFHGVPSTSVRYTIADATRAGVGRDRDLVGGWDYWLNARLCSAIRSAKQAYGTRTGSTCWLSDAHDGLLCGRFRGYWLFQGCASLVALFNIASGKTQSVSCRLVGSHRIVCQRFSWRIDSLRRRIGETAALSPQRFALTPNCGKPPTRIYRAPTSSELFAPWP